MRLREINQYIDIASIVQLKFTKQLCTAQLQNETLTQFKNNERESKNFTIVRTFIHRSFFMIIEVLFGPQVGKVIMIAFAILKLISLIMTEVYKRKVKIVGSSCIESFRTTRVNSQLRRLPIENFYAVGARYSGPIALLYRKYESKQLKLPENYDTHILFFNCRGEIQRTVPFDLKQRVILFQFTPDEQLLIIYATGAYFLVDSATGDMTQGNYITGQSEQQRNKNRCVGAQLLEEKIVMIRERTIGIVDSINGQWRPYSVIKLHPEQQIFSSQLNNDGEIEITYLSRQCTIQCLNLKKWENSNAVADILVPSTILKGNYVNLIAIYAFNQTVILIYPNMALMGKPNALTQIAFGDIKIDKQDPLCKSKSKYRYRNFYQLGLIGTAAFFYDRRRFLLFSPKDKSFVLVPRQLTYSSNLLTVDRFGLRLIDEHTFIYRCINNPIYYSIAQQAEIAKQCYLLTTNNQQKIFFGEYEKLADIYDAHIEKRPIQMNDVRDMANNVEKVWLALLDVAGFYINPGEQLRVLRFANFLQNFYDIKNQSHRVRSLTKTLRVVNGLRLQHMNRWLTHQQFQYLISLKNDRFLLLLLRYNMHFTADMVFQDSKSKEKIFAHWSRCKIEKETETGALEEIRTRYQQMKVSIGSTFVFTELAKYCLDRNLASLALKLIELEPHQGRRCMVFLLIFKARKDSQNVDKLLEYAEQSGESSTVHYTLQSLRKMSDWLPVESWLSLLPKKPILESHYIKILKSENNEEELQQYLTTNKLYLDLGYISLGRQFSRNPQITEKEAQQLILKDYTKLLPSLAENLQKCVPRKGMQILRELKDKKYPITEDDAKQLTLDGEFECLADLIIQKDNNIPLATRILRQIKSQKVYSILLRIGKVKDGIEEAFIRKNKEKIMELMPYAEEDTQEYAKQMYQELLNAR